MYKLSQLKRIIFFGVYLAIIISFPLLFSGCQNKKKGGGNILKKVGQKSTLQDSQKQQFPELSRDLGNKNNEPLLQKYFSKNNEKQGNTFFYRPQKKSPAERDEKLITILRSQTQYIMSLSDKEILNRMPVQTPRIHNGCPNCRKNGDKSNKYWDQQQPRCFGKYHGHEKVYNPLYPNRYSCPECKESFPDNFKYPINASRDYIHWTGKKIKIEFHKSSGREFFLKGVLDTERHHWISNQMVKLAQLYYESGDTKAGRTAAVILNAYADRFPNWLYTDAYGKKYAINNHARRMGSGIIQTREGRRECDEINGPNGYLEAVKFLAGTDAVKSFGKELGIDFQAKLWDNVLRITFERSAHSATYPEFNLREFGQNCPVDPVGFAKIFKRPGLIRDKVIKALEYTPRMVTGIDGSFFQGSGYSQIHLLAMRNMTKVNGYSDPVDFILPQGEIPIKNYHYPYGPHEDYWMKAYNFPAKIRLPNGGLPIVNECQHNWLLNFPGLGVPKRKSRDFIAPGLGYAILGDGNDDEQIQLHLNYSPNNVNHGQQDTLSFHLYAFGHYLMDDSEYTKNSIRRYTASTAGHNTVVVDFKSQGGGGPYNEGSPILYDGRSPGIKVISVDAARAYKELSVSKYQRTLILNTYEKDRPYIVDIFQVKGGKVKDYMLRSSYQHLSSGEISYDMKKIGNGEVLLPEKLKSIKSPALGYPLFSKVREAEADKNGILTYKVQKPWEPRKNLTHSRLKDLASILPFKFDQNLYADKPNVGTRHHIVGMPEQKIYFFNSPDTFESLYDGRGKETDYENWDQVPHCMLRYDSDDVEEEKVFIVVHEPFVNKAQIVSVEKLEQESPGLIALEVKFGDRKDTILFSTSNSASSGKINGIVFNGRLGVVSEKGKNVESYLLGGTKLFKPNVTSLSSNIDKLEGEVVKSYRKWHGYNYNAFAVKYSGPAPDTDNLKGSFAVLKNTSKIINLEKENFANPGMLPLFYYRNKNLSNDVRKRLQESGAGWGFVIERVEKDGDHLIVFTKGDHGLEIEDGKTREFCFPMREFNSNPTMVIFPSASSQRPPEPDKAGGAFMEPIEVKLSTQTGNQQIFYALNYKNESIEPCWLSNGKPIISKSDKYKPKWKLYTKPLSIERNAQLWIKGKLGNAIREQPPEVYNFSIAEKAWDLPNPQPGLETVIKSNGSTATKTLSGFLKVPKAGIYTIYFKPDHRAELFLNSKKYIAGTKVDIPTPYAFKVPLKAGFYPIKIRSSYSFKNEQEHTQKHFKIEWVTPEGSRCEIPQNAFVHTSN